MKAMGNGHSVIFSHYAEIPGLQNNVRNSRRQRTRQNWVWKSCRFTDGLQCFGEITQMIMIMKIVMLLFLSLWFDNIGIAYICTFNDSWSDWQARNVHYVHLLNSLTNCPVVGWWLLWLLSKDEFIVYGGRLWEQQVDGGYQPTP